MNSASEDSRMDEERVQHLKRALDLAAGGSFDDALSEIAASGPGVLGEIEEMLKSFFADLKDANVRMEEVIGELDSSRRELESRLQTILTQREAIRELS